MGVLSLSCLLILTVHTDIVAAQSAWTRNKNSGFARFSVSTLNTSSFYTPLGNTISSAQYRDVTASFYGEYGITNNLTVMTYFPFLRTHELETTDSLTSIGDAVVGFKYRFLRGNTPLAVAVDFGIPTGEHLGIVSTNGVPGGTFRLPTGDGEFNTRVSLYASRAFRDGRNFLSGGGNFRTRGYTDEISYFVNAGHRLVPSLWVTGTVMGLTPAGEPNIEQSVGFGVGEGVQYITIGGELQYRISQRYSLSFGYYDPVKERTSWQVAALSLESGWSFSVPLHAYPQCMGIMMSYHWLQGAQYEAMLVPKEHRKHAVDHEKTDRKH